MVGDEITLLANLSNLRLLGSLLVLGSNPNSDFNTKVKFSTEYRVERLYPFYYNTRRPQPQGIPSSLSYGGKSFDITLTKDDLSGNIQNLESTTVVVLRTGFSTHTMNMGQRMVVLEMSHTGNADGSATLHVSQIPPNPAIMPPGPALVFVVVNGVPSVASQVMVGSGRIETQKVQAVQALPQSKMATSEDLRPNSSTAASASGPSSTSSNNASSTGAGAGPVTPLADSQSASVNSAISIARSSLWLEVLMSSVFLGIVAFTSLV